MKTILLLAGLSKRFWPLEEKPFLSIGGKTIVEHQIERLKKAGLSDITLVAGAHNIRQARALLKGMVVVEQKDISLGMRGALLSALPAFKNQPILIVNSNDLLDATAYEQLMAAWKTTKTDGLLLAKKVKEYFPGGYVQMKTGRITGIVEKPGKGKEPSDLVTIVAHIHRSSTDLLDALKKVRPSHDDGYEQALTLLFKTHHYQAVRLQSSWQAVKYPWHLLTLLPLVLDEITKERIDRSAVVHPLASIQGPVILSKGVKVMAHATVVGPCFVGENSIIANNALVRQSSVGSNCVIGYSTEVARSVIGDDVWTHSSYIGDSVVGDNVAFGAGSVTGNLRLDEAPITSDCGGEPIDTGLTKLGAIIGPNCRIGIHVSILPGMKIGRDSFISSATVVSADVPERSFVKMKDTAMDVRPNRRQALSPEHRMKFKKKV